MNTIQNRELDMSRMSRQEQVDCLYDIAFSNYSRLLAEYDKPVSQWTDAMRQRAAREHGFETMRGRYHNMAAAAYMDKHGMDKNDEELWEKARRSVTRLIEGVMSDLRAYRQTSDSGYGDFDPSDPYGRKYR